MPAEPAERRHDALLRAIEEAEDEEGRLLALRAYCAAVAAEAPPLTPLQRAELHAVLAE